MQVREVFDRDTSTRTCIHDFGSMEEVHSLVYNMIVAPNPEIKQLQRESAGYNSTYNFTGTHSLSHALDLSRNGWPEGTAMLEETTARIQMEDLQSTTRPMPYFDVMGEEVSIDRYLTNERDDMVAYNMTEDPRNKSLEVFVEGSQSYKVPKERIIGRGAGILAGVQVMQAKGYSVGITYTTAVASQYPVYSGVNYRSEYYVPLQQIGEVASTDALAFALINPSMGRRFMFSVADQIEPDEVKRAIGIGRYGKYGTPSNSLYVPERPHPTLLIPSEIGLDTAENAAQTITDMMVSAVVDHEQQGW